VPPGSWPARWIAPPPPPRARCARRHAHGCQCANGTAVTAPTTEPDCKETAPAGWPAPWGRRRSAQFSDPTHLVLPHRSTESLVNEGVDEAESIDDHLHTAH
jgi:hypothetical protein